MRNLAGATQVGSRGNSAKPQMNPKEMPQKIWSKRDGSWGCHVLIILMFNNFIRLVIWVANKNYFMYRKYAMSKLGAPWIGWSTTFAASIFQFPVFLHRCDGCRNCMKLVLKIIRRTKNMSTSVDSQGTVAGNYESIRPFCEHLQDLFSPTGRNDFYGLG